MPRRPRERTASRRCLIPTCPAALDWTRPWPSGWKGQAGPGAAPLFACPAHSRAWPQHHPAARHYPDEGGVAAACACGWTTVSAPTLGTLEELFLVHLVPHLVDVAVTSGRRGMISP